MVQFDSEAVIYDRRTFIGLVTDSCQLDKYQCVIY